MKRKFLSALICGMLSMGLMAPIYGDLWKKRIVQHSVDMYDIHLSIPDKLSEADDEYEKELLLFISNKAVKDGYDYFTFTVDATDKNIVIVHVQNFSQIPSTTSVKEETVVKYFVAKDILRLN